jgi:hypothetical protein
MPMDFPDETLERYAEMVRFRAKEPEESIDEYRIALADHVESIDPCEAMEIRTGKGWNKWSSMDFEEVISKSPELIGTNPVITIWALRRKHVKS